MATSLIKSFQKLTLARTQLRRCLHNVAVQDVGSLRIPPTIFSSLKIGTSQTKSETTPSKHELTGVVSNKEYSLPGLTNTSETKIVILDPSMRINEYQLPTAHTAVTEKVTPALTEVVIEDPLPVGIAEEKQAKNFYVIRIRKKMHKRNRQKRVKVRDLFINRQNNRRKVQIWDARITAAEEKWAERANAFEPQRYINQQSAMARMGGYRVDVVQEYFAEQKEKQN